MIIDGKKIRDDILNEVKASVQLLSFVPVFCDILVGDDQVSAQYVRMKEKTAESVGIKFRRADFSITITTEELIEEIENLNRVPHICGIIVQLPLPSHLDTQSIINTIKTELDVDCLGDSASKLFYENKNPIGFPAALSCMKIFDYMKIDLRDKNIVVLGQGMLVGKPVAHLIRNRGFDVNTINSKTENIDELLKNADIIISGIGHGKFITANKIKEGAIVIDAGTSEDSGSVIGDVDLDSVEKVASYVSPTPGGVGPVTVAMLLKNVIKVAQKKLL